MKEEGGEAHEGLLEGGNSTVTVSGSFHGLLSATYARQSFSLTILQVNIVWPFLAMMGLNVWSVGPIVLIPPRPLCALSMPRKCRCGVPTPCCVSHNLLLIFFSFQHCFFCEKRANHASKYSVWCRGFLKSGGSSQPFGTPGGIHKKTPGLALSQYSHFLSHLFDSFFSTFMFTFLCAHVHFHQVQFLNYIFFVYHVLFPPASLFNK